MPGTEEGFLEVRGGPFTMADGRPSGKPERYLVPLEILLWTCFRGKLRMKEVALAFDRRNKRNKCYVAGRLWGFVLGNPPGRRVGDRRPRGRLAPMGRQRPTQHGLRRDRVAGNFAPGRKRSDGSGIDLHTTCNVRWVAKLGSENYSSPVIADGRVFIGRTTPRWTTRVTIERRRPAALPRRGHRPTALAVGGAQVDGRPWSPDFDDMSLGICSTPTVEGNRVYLVSNRCDVLCVDADGMANGNDGGSSTSRTTRSSRANGRSRRGRAMAISFGSFDMLNRLPVFRTTRPAARRWSTATMSTSAPPTASTKAEAPMPLSPPDRAGQTRRPSGGPRRGTDGHAGVPRPVVVAFAGAGPPTTGGLLVPATASVMPSTRSPASRPPWASFTASGRSIATRRNTGSATASRSTTGKATNVKHRRKSGRLELSRTERNHRHARVL